MRSSGPPPGNRTLALLIEAAADRECPYCKAEPQVPCTWPSPDKYHVVRFKRIGMTETERRTVEAATRIDSSRNGPKDFLVGELPLYRPEPRPEPDPELDLEAG